MRVVRTLALTYSCLIIPGAVENSIRVISNSTAVYATIDEIQAS